MPTEKASRFTPEMQVFCAGFLSMMLDAQIMFVQYDIFVGCPAE